MAFEDEIDALANVLGDWDFCLVVKSLEGFVLFFGDVDGRRELAPRHGSTIQERQRGGNSVIQAARASTSPEQASAWAGRRTGRSRSRSAAWPTGFCHAGAVGTVCAVVAVADGLVAQQPASGSRAGSSGQKVAARGAGV